MTSSTGKLVVLTSTTQNRQRSNSSVCEPKNGIQIDEGKTLHLLPLEEKLPQNLSTIIISSTKLKRVNRISSFSALPSIILTPHRHIRSDLVVYSLNGAPLAHARTETVRLAHFDTTYNNYRSTYTTRTVRQFLR